jgi:peptide/nickel transport system substrate-binding protein
MRFVRDEWVAGSRAVFEKYAGYVPRQEPGAWLAGGKQIHIDRVEWFVMPDPATASAAIQNGEVDWWDNVLFDLVPVLRKSRNVTVDVGDTFGKVGMLRLNHLHPPFNDVRARRAILAAMNQEDYLRAIRGNDVTQWKAMPGFFTPGTPLYNEEGGDILLGPRDLNAAKRLLTESGYSGEPITCLAAQDIATFKVWGEVTADLLKQMGMTVDLAAVDMGTMVARRSRKVPPSQGGWHMFLTVLSGADCANPATYPYLHANGDAAYFGWPNSPQIEAEITAWFEADTLDKEKAVSRRLNKAAFENVVFAPTGWYTLYQAWRSNISGIVKGPLPFFWGVTKTA